MIKLKLLTLETQSLSVADNHKIYVEFNETALLFQTKTDQLRLTHHGFHIKLYDNIGSLSVIVIYWFKYILNKVPL